MEIDEKNLNLIKEIVSDCEGFIREFYGETLDYPSQLRRFNRDMEPIETLRKNLPDIF